MFSRDLTVLPEHPHVHPQSERAIPVFAFRAINGTHLPTPEGWKTEWTLVRSSPGRDSNLQPPDCKSDPTTQPLAHVWLNHRNTQILHLSYRAEFGRCGSKDMGVIAKILGDAWHHPLRWCAYHPRKHAWW